MSAYLVLVKIHPPPSKGSDIEARLHVSPKDFYHNECVTFLQGNPDKSARLCHKFRMGGCSDGATCSFAHIKPQILLEKNLISKQVASKLVANYEIPTYGEGGADGDGDSPLGDSGRDYVAVDCNDSLRCAVCRNVWTHPIELNCEHIFCRKCLVNTMKTSQQCPLCRGTISTYKKPNRALVAQADTAIVSCTVCKQTMPRGSWENHVCSKQSTTNSKKSSKDNSATTPTRSVPVEDDVSRKLMEATRVKARIEMEVKEIEAILSMKHKSLQETRDHIEETRKQYESLCAKLKQENDEITILEDNYSELKLQELRSTQTWTELMQLKASSSSISTTSQQQQHPNVWNKAQSPQKVGGTTTTTNFNPFASTTTSTSATLKKFDWGPTI